jgi:hypothetical protein
VYYAAYWAAREHLETSCGTNYDGQLSHINVAKDLDKLLGESVLSQDLLSLKKKREWADYEIRNKDFDFLEARTIFNSAKRLIASVDKL